ncbi:hypothetical protein D3C73_1527530 [compost metagenome]
MGAFAGAVAVGNHAIGVFGLVDGHGHGRGGDHEQATEKQQAREHGQGFCRVGTEMEPSSCYGLG